MNRRRDPSVSRFEMLETIARKMPPTRRTLTYRFHALRKITRRRSRRSSWLELLDLHHSDPSTLQLNPTIPTNNRHEEDTTALEGLGRDPVSNEEADTVERGGNENCEDANVTNPGPCSHEESIDEDTRTEQESECLSSLCDSQDNINTRLLPTDDFPPSGDALSALQKKSSFVLNSANIMAMILVCGSVRFTVQQYEVVRSLVKHAKEDTQLPSYSTVQRKLFPHFMRNCFPRSQLRKFAKGLSPESHTSGDVRTNDNSTCEERQCQAATAIARIVYPTEWAKMDVSTLPYYENIFGYQRASSSRADTFVVEESMIVQKRQKIVNVSSHIFVNGAYGRTAVTAGDLITFNLRTLPAVVTPDALTRNKYYYTLSEQKVSICAQICASWCVGSEGNPTKSGVYARRTVGSVFQDVVRDFSVPFANVSTHGVHSTAHSQSHHRFYTTSVDDMQCLKPGDTCTLLRPQHKSVPELSIIILSRFWRTYHGTPSQILMWLRHQSATASSPPSHEVVATQILESLPSKARGSLQSQVRPSNADISCFDKRDSGILLDGRPYVVYRFLLYCDDFKETTSPYSQKSAGGVYLLPIGLSLKAKSSSRSVHIISLTPPGLSTNEVLLDIVPDILKGTIEGVEGRTPPVAYSDMLKIRAIYASYACNID